LYEENKPYFFFWVYYDDDSLLLSLLLLYNNRYLESIISIKKPTTLYNNNTCKVCRGYYMAAQRYEISLTSERSERVKYLSNTREILYLQADVIFFLLYKILTMQQNMI